LCDKSLLPENGAGGAGVEVISGGVIDAVVVVAALVVVMVLVKQMLTVHKNKGFKAVVPDVAPV
jgi:hypothetical protein